MRALLCKEWGPPSALVVEEVPDLVPGDSEVVLRVHAAGVNFPDGLIIQNKYQFKPELPFSPGGEAAGVIEAVGTRVKHVGPGERVIAFAPYGAFAEQMRCDARMLVPLLGNLEFTTGAAFVMTYATAYHALVDRAALQAGETVVVLGAAGGVGLACVEVAKALGARVIAAASTAEKRAVCTEHGADETVAYETDDLKARLTELTGGKGVDVVVDPVGGRFTEAALRSCAWRGRLLVVGFTAGDIPKIPANLPLLKGCAVVGVFWGDYARREPMRALGDLRVLFGWLQKGKLRPHITATYPLERAGEAIAALMERRVSGKLVIIPVPT